MLRLSKVLYITVQYLSDEVHVIFPSKYLFSFFVLKLSKALYMTVECLSDEVRVMFSSNYLWVLCVCDLWLEVDCEVLISFFLLSSQPCQRRAGVCEDP